MLISRLLKIKGLEVDNVRRGFLQQKDRVVSGSFLSAHQNSHFLTLKGSINRGALLYLPSLPT